MDGRTDGRTDPSCTFRRAPITGEKPSVRCHNILRCNNENSPMCPTIHSTSLLSTRLHANRKRFHRFHLLQPRPHPSISLSPYHSSSFLHSFQHYITNKVETAGINRVYNEMQFTAMGLPFGPNRSQILCSVTMTY
jgi:hypothetical protein